MQHQPFCRFPVKSVADNRIVKSLRMSAVNSQLMGASSNRRKLQQSMPILVPKHAIMCLSRLPMQFIDHLTRAVVEVKTQRKTDFSLLSDRNLTFEEGMIDLVYVAMKEEVLQLMILLFGQSNEHQTARIHIESMHNERPFCRWNGTF